MRKLLYTILISLLCIAPLHAGVSFQGCELGGAYYVAPIADGFVGNKEGSDDGQSEGLAPDDAVWQSFVATTSGQVTYGHCKLSGAVGNYNFAIYDSAGTTKLKDANVTAINVSGIDWAHFQLDSALEVTATTTYVLACGQKTDGDNWCRARMTGDLGNTVHYDGTYDVEDSMPASVDSDDSTGNYEVLIYADNSAT